MALFPARCSHTGFGDYRESDYQKLLIRRIPSYAKGGTAGFLCEWGSMDITYQQDRSAGLTVGHTPLDDTIPIIQRGRKSDYALAPFS